jgi:hypothetical protein
MYKLAGLHMHVPGFLYRSALVLDFSSRNTNVYKEELIEVASGQSYFNPCTIHLYM